MTNHERNVPNFAPGLEMFFAYSFGMARSLHVDQGEFPYHVVAKCINGDWFSIPMERVWEIVSEQLYFVHHAYGLRILSFVLMSNHFQPSVTSDAAGQSGVKRWAGL